MKVTKDGLAPDAFIHPMSYPRAIWAFSMITKSERTSLSSSLCSIGSSHGVLFAESAAPPLFSHFFFQNPFTRGKNACLEVPPHTNSKVSLTDFLIMHGPAKKTWNNNGNPIVSKGGVYFETRNELQRWTDFFPWVFKCRDWPIALLRKKYSFRFSRPLTHIRTRLGKGNKAPYN